MGKTWMGPKLCGDSATEPLRVALCGHLQKGNVLLISIVASVLSFQTLCLYAPPEGMNEKYWYWEMRMYCIKYMDVTMGEWTWTHFVCFPLKSMTALSICFKRQRTESYVCKVEPDWLLISHSSLNPCVWHREQITVLTWPAYTELFPSASVKKKMQSRLKFKKECKRNAFLHGSATVWLCCTSVYFTDVERSRTNRCARMNELLVYKCICKWVRFNSIWNCNVSGSVHLAEVWFFCKCSDICKSDFQNKI